MSKPRVFLRRASLPWLVLIAFAAVGCAPGLHQVRLRTADGQVRTTVPRPRPPLALADEQVQQATAVLARRVVPVADPLELARQRFEVPIRGGAYAFNPRTKQLRPLDDAAAAAEAWPPELVEQTRGYLQWCGNIRQHGDCLQLLRHGKVLDAHGRYAVAMAIAQGSTIEATRASLKGMVNPDAVMAMLVSGMTMYMMLWVLPEPVSKGIAAVMTAVLVVYLGVDTLYTLGRGWRRLVERADEATTFQQLRDAGEELAEVMGADVGRILVMLATAAVGGGASGLAKVAPTLPGAAQVSRLAVAEGGIALEAVGSVEAVVIAESGLTIALAPGAVVTTSLMSGKDSGGPPAPGQEGTLSEPPGEETRARSAANALRLRKQLASEAGAAELKAGGGAPVAGAGTRAPITDLPRLVAEYGGHPADWAKVSSRVYPVGDGTTVQVHAYRNVRTGQLVELKTKVE